ncbi:MAG: ATP-binding protein [Chitinophagales bacterium]
MKTIPQVIQELENQLAQTKDIAKGAIWVELINLYGANGQYSKLIEGADILMNLADTHQDTRLKMESLFFSAKMSNNQRKFEEATVYLNEIASLNKKTNDQEIWLRWHYMKANVAQKQNQFEQTKAHIEELFALASSEDATLKVSAHQLLIGIHHSRNEFDQAFKYLFAALELLEKLEVKGWSDYLQTSLLNMNAVMLYRVQMGSLKGKVEDTSDISYHLEKGHKLALALQYKPLILESQIQFGHLEGDKGNHEAAIEYYRAALEMAQLDGDEYTALYCNTFIANIHQKQHKLDIAIAHYQSALDLAEKMSSKMLVIDCGISLAECFLERKQHLIAIKYVEEALALAEEIKLNKKCLSAYELLARIYKAMGNADEVFTYLQKHIDLKNTIFTNEKEKSIVEMQTRYETEKKEQEAEQLRILEQVKSRFFSQITHEFRTPLTLILGPVQQLLQHPKIQSDLELQNRLILVERNGERLSSLVNQLLDLSKLESGKMTIQKKHGDVIAFAKAIVTNFQTLAQQQNIHLYFNTSLLQLPANFDVDKLEKILYNLLSNAFKFTPSNGEITLKLQILQSENDNPIHLQIILQDTGKGIAAAQLPHIFDRFYQADNSNVREAEGSGVGLSLVKELIELQGGTIEVKSEINVGTTFTFHLPLELSEVHQIIPIAEKTSVQSSSFKTFNTTLKDAFSNKKKAKSRTENKGKNIVLVVEDNPDMQTYIQSILSPQYEVLQAVNGEMGVNTALEEVPDLIVSDVMMPKKDGYTLCKELKTNEKTNHIPIILLTAKAALDSRIEGLQQGADVYLSKPFSPKELLLNIENQIKVRQQLQEKYSQILQSPDKESSKESITNPFLQKLIDTIETHLNDIQLSVKQLSEYMYMSRQQIHRKLRALTNYSTSEFIRLIRLQKAKELLQSQQYTMTEIAYEVGFSTPSYFSRSFTKQFGVSPSKWSGE